MDGEVASLLFAQGGRGMASLVGPESGHINKSLANQKTNYLSFEGHHVFRDRLQS